MGVMPYLLETSRQPLLPSMAIPGLPSLPDQPTPDEKKHISPRSATLLSGSKGWEVPTLRKLSEGFDS